MVQLVWRTGVEDCWSGGAGKGLFCGQLVPRPVRLRLSWAGTARSPSVKKSGIAVAGVGDARGR